MGSSVNIVAVLISNILAILMLAMLLLNSTWKFRGNDTESKLVLAIITIVGLMCVVEPVSFVLDGMPGRPIRTLLHFLNALLFICDMLIGPMWVTVLTTHMSGKVSLTRRRVINSICTVETLLILMNLFAPVIFSMDENNRYVRGPLFFVFMAILFLFLLDALGVYAYAKMKGGNLKFFPISQFLIPLMIGAFIQIFFYGTSLVWPAGAVSICGVLLGFQNETVFRDELTGLYNRYYLDNLKKNAKSRKNQDYTIVMMDLNGFKSINDNYGHAEGDVALVQVGNILNKSVGRMGSAIRYAGDEFIVLLNTQDKESIQTVLGNIRESLEQCNDVSEKDYKLGLSIGVLEINLRDQSLDDIMREVDRRMYEDKKRFYEENPRYDRRKMMLN